jgi:UDP-glucose 4-epimerase
MKTSVLVTGACGYVGGRVAAVLAESGYQVYCGTRKADLSPPDWLPSMRMVYIDWHSDEMLVEACRGMDFIIHLAAMNEIESAEDPVAALAMNGVSTLRLLNASIAAGVRRFLYFSTAHVYGAPLQGEVNELTLPRPTHPYAISHKVAEDFILAAHDLRKIEGVVIRLSNGFGAPVTPKIDRWTLLVNDLCRQAVENGELRLKSSGEQLRDFITLGNVARAVTHLMSLDRHSLADGLFNLGSGKAVSILEMAEKVVSRWKVLSGNEIQIIRPSSNISKALPLDYQSNKLGSTGFTLLSDHDEEIDATLKLCKKTYGCDIQDE